MAEQRFIFDDYLASMWLAGFTLEDVMGDDAFEVLTDEECLAAVNKWESMNSLFSINCMISVTGKDMRYNRRWVQKRRREKRGR